MEEYRLGRIDDSSESIDCFTEPEKLGENQRPCRGRAPTNERMHGSGYLRIMPPKRYKERQTKKKAERSARKKQRRK